MTTTALTQGAHHIGLTVPDLSQTRSFFIDALGFSQVGEVADYPAVFLSDGTTIEVWARAGSPSRFRQRSRSCGLSRSKAATSSPECVAVVSVTIGSAMGPWAEVRLEHEPSRKYTGVAQNTMVRAS